MVGRKDLIINYDWKTKRKEFNMQDESTTEALNARASAALTKAKHGVLDEQRLCPGVTGSTQGAATGHGQLCIVDALHERS